MNYYNQYQRNILPPQQILQANGKASIDNLLMSPNSSVLIADSTAPIVWRCVSDGLGNVTAEAFDIIPHKTEEEVKQDSLLSMVEQLNMRMEKLEGAIYEQSAISTGTDNTEFVTDNAGNKKRTKSASHAKPDDGE